MSRVINNYFITITHCEGLLIKSQLVTWISANYTSYCVAQEDHNGLADDGSCCLDGYHFHVVVRANEGSTIAADQLALRSWLASLRLPESASRALGLDFVPCRDVAKSLKYITKEDVVPAFNGFDYHMLNPLCQLHSIACMNPYDSSHPFAFTQRTTSYYTRLAWQSIYAQHMQYRCCKLCVRDMPHGVFAESD